MIIGRSWTVTCIFDMTFGSKKVKIHASSKIAFRILRCTVINKGIPIKKYWFNYQANNILFIVYFRCGVERYCFIVTFMQPMKWQYISLLLTSLLSPDTKSILPLFIVWSNPRFFLTWFCLLTAVVCVFGETVDEQP